MNGRLGLFKRVGIIVMCALAAFSYSGCSSNNAPLDPKNPVTVTIWNYYNGDQLAAFEQLIEQFNSTVGAQKGVVALSVSQGDINTLANSLIASANGDVGSQPAPNLAAVYSETAFILEKAGKLASLDEYFTKEELDKYVPGFLEEGRFGECNKLMLFPILKSSEVFTVNETYWEPFALYSGITPQSLSSKEDLTAAAKVYYEWTDGLTPDVLNDGKALYGRDSIANYIYIGCYQLGHELFKVNNGKIETDMDRDTFKTLWDNYYIPFVNGYFGSYAKFRSEDCKTGRILSLTSSSSSAGYLPVAVTTSDDSTHDISTYMNKDLPFAGAVNDAVVQQGASYCLLKSSASEQAGAVEFLKWFTQADRNLSFALMSGYSPVVLTANTSDAITKAYTGDVSSAKGQNVLNSLIIVSDTFAKCDTYSVKPFDGSKEIREVLGDSLENIAKSDREAVVASMEKGLTHEEAVAPFISEDYFDAWFNKLQNEINSIVAR